jgi:hypothetical protein
VSHEIFSQSSVENILKEISGNNKTLIANSQSMKSKKLESMVGQSLYNPFIEVTNLFGPNDAGDQTEFKLIQPFDFPTSYSKRNKVSDLKIQQTGFEHSILKQDILLEAKLICFELIYFNKKRLQLLRRMQTSEVIHEMYLTKMNRGEGNVLDVNKSKLNLANADMDLLLVENKIKEFNDELTELNGGKKIIFNDTIYPSVPVLPDFVTLESKIESNDPVRKLLYQEKLISQGQTELSKNFKPAKV